MINDPHNREIAGIRLAPGGFAGSRTADTDDPVTWFGAYSIHRHFLGAAVLHNLKMLVLEIRNPISGNQRLDDLDDQHDQ